MPPNVRRVASRVAQASELSQVHVADPRAAQLCAQGLLVELRIVSRPRDTAHIYDTLYSVRSQKIEEYFPRARGMPNGKDSGGTNIFRQIPASWLKY
jgi:hypothetical protein